MDNRIPQYQRAVTPTIESNAPSGLIRGKVLSYNNTNNLTSNNLIRGSPYIRNSPITLSPRQPVTAGYIDINVMGRNASSQSKAAVANKASELQPSATTSGPGNFSKYDLIPIQDEVPPDGIIFSKLRSNHEALVVHRTTEERLRNPERLNLDKRQLEICPILEQEQKLRLLNFQNNYIRVIQNLENLPNLIFLDLYNNKITTLAGSLSMVKGLRVLMTGKNKISAITNLTNLRKLDVLDLHSNDISVVEGLDTLVDLRVLNLAGNKITQIQNGLSALGSLTELNLRRNKLDNVNGLNKLPALQRVFLSHNLISSVEGVQSLFEVPYLIELSLDGNPLSEDDPVEYRKAVIAGIPGLRHLDLKRVTDEERHPYQESGLGLSIAGLIIRIATDYIALLIFTYSLSQMRRDQTHCWQEVQVIWEAFRLQALTIIRRLPSPIPITDPSLQIWLTSPQSTQKEAFLAASPVEQACRSISSHPLKAW